MRPLLLTVMLLQWHAVVSLGTVLSLLRLLGLENLGELYGVRRTSCDEIE